MPRQKLPEIDEIKKKCHRCGCNTPIGGYYINRGWKDEYFRDVWCKKCVQKNVLDEKSMMDYCEFNRRKYQPDLWKLAINNTTLNLNADEKWVDMKDLTTKNKVFWQTVISSYFRGMNRNPYYVYIPPYTESGVENPMITDEYVSKHYSKEWHGFYTKNELNYLNEYYAGLEKDFKLENSAYVDYAKKVCKASLAMDNAFADMMDEKPGAEKRYKDCKDIFDVLSQSAKFAEKTRSENDSVGYGSLGELIKRMESTGFLQKKIEFEKDDIDAVIDDFRWILSSVGEDF